MSQNTTPNIKLDELVPNVEFAGEYGRVHIRVRCQASLGQTVGVCGSIETLGNFEKNKYLQLYTTPESYPVWSTLNPILVPLHKPVSYKYCLVENGDIKTHEKCDNRHFSSNDVDLFLNDFFMMNEMESTIDLEQDLLNEMKLLSAATEESKIDLTQLAKDARLIIVCYHLPVLLKRTSNPSSPFIATWAESLIAKSSDNSISHSFDTFWMGTVSVPGDEPTAEEMTYLFKILADINCIPIFLDPVVANKAYNGFCKSIMWPIFHNVDQMDQIHAAWKLLPPNVKSVQDNLSTEDVLDWNHDIDDLQSAYQLVNQIFADRLASWLHPGDTVWVHDYHLIFLPQLIRDLNRNIHVIFFLHIPFPTSQIFRSLPAATNILTSMSAADVVGFHTFDHARHFLTAMKRIVGIRSHTKQGGILALNVQDREVIVTVSHVSVETNDINRAIENPETWARAANIKKQYQGRKVIIGLDVGQRLSGGILKLAAYEKFLTDYPREASKVVLIQKMIRSSSRQGDEETTHSDMMEMVNRINEKFSVVAPDGLIWPAVYYEEVPLRSVSLADRVSLWLAADVYLLTPIKEGLNLYPLEYIYVRETAGCVEHGQGAIEPAKGVVIASEFSTCSTLLNGSLKINPYYTLTVADTILKALHMPVMEAQQRRQRDMGFISSHPSSLWTKEIISDLRHLSDSGFTCKTLNLRGTVLAVLPSPLPMEKVSDAFQEGVISQNYGVTDVVTRVFIFDYGGTLLNKEKSDIYMKQSLSAISGRTPTEKMMEAVRILAKDPRNAILIMTGLTKLKLGELFSDLSDVTIGTSNGLVYSWGKNLLLEDEVDVIKSASKFQDMSPTANAASSSNNSLLKLTMKDINVSASRWWDSLHFDINWEAVRDIAVPIITKFTFRTNGTCQTPRIPGIGWSYFGADPEWGEKQAIQCRIELEAALANHDVKVVSQIQGSIEVVPKKLNKGVLAKQFLERLQRKRAGLLPTFTLVIGDDESDDYMFQATYQHFSSCASDAALGNSRVFTSVVGRQKCAAHYYVNSVQDVENLLSTLAAATLSPSMRSSPPSPKKKTSQN